MDVYVPQKAVIAQWHCQDAEKAGGAAWALSPNDLYM